MDFIRRVILCMPNAKSFYLIAEQIISKNKVDKN